MEEEANAGFHSNRVVCRVFHFWFFSAPLSTCTCSPHALHYDLGAFGQRRPEHLLRPARWTRGNDGRLEEGSEPSTVL